MAYISLYRKYRPRTFDDVVGQETTVKILKNSIKNNQISHAYIFSGPRGTGKTSIAKIFSKAINCENNKNGNVCGKCEVCLNNTDDEMDIIEIDAASNNGVDEIREIRNNVKLMPSKLKYKVYIIDEVHMLSTSAFNALLKTLEEPPAHIVFILATTEFNKIPATVVSRCQKFDFKKLKHNEIVDRLNKILELEKKELDIENVNLIAELSEGGMRDAINLLDQVLNVNKTSLTEEEIYDIIGDISNEKMFVLLKNITSGNLKETLNIHDKMYEEGKNFINIANKLEITVKNLIIYNSTDNFFDKNYENKLSKFVKVDVNKLLKLSSIIFELINELKKNSNQKLVSEMYFIKMTLLFEESDNNKKIELQKEVDDSVIKNKEVENKEKNTDEDDNHKDILINNALFGANKELKIDFLNEYEKINEYLSIKEFNAISTLLLKANVEVVSDKNLIFTFKNNLDVVLFDKNNEEIQKLLKDIYNVKYSIVAITSSKWKNVKEEYINNIKNGIKYSYIEEAPKSKKKKNSELEKNVENIFGEEYITIE